MICGKIVYDMPMMSFGVGDAYTRTDKKTDVIPTKSGVCGLIANALHLERRDPFIDKYLYKKMRIFLNHEESEIDSIIIRTNFHTVNSDKKYQANGGVKNMNYPTPRKERIECAKYTLYYYYDGHEEFTRFIDECLSNPERPLYAGRKEFPMPHNFNKGIVDVNIDDLSKMEEITKISTFRERFR